MKFQLRWHEIILYDYIYICFKPLEINVRPTITFVYFCIKILFIYSFIHLNIKSSKFLISFFHALVSLSLPPTI